MNDLVFFSDLMGDDLLTRLDDFLLLVAFSNEDFLLDNMTLVLLLLLAHDLPDNGHDAAANTESNNRSDYPSISTAWSAILRRSAESSVVLDLNSFDYGLSILGAVSSFPGRLILPWVPSAAVRCTLSFSTAQPASSEAGDSLSVHGLLIVA